MPLSDHLVEKLRKEQFEIERFLLTKQPDSALEPTRESANKRLLALTNPAIEVLGQILDQSSNDDTRMKAANSILDRSPATKQVISEQGERALPLEALQILMSGLRGMLELTLPPKGQDVPIQAPNPTKTILAPNQRTSK